MNDPEIRENSFSATLREAIERYPEVFNKFDYTEFSWIKTIEYKYPF